MQYNPFQILGVSENVTQNELYDAYKALKREYSDKRFAPGAEGAEAAAKLQEIEEAYAAANDILRSSYTVSSAGGNTSVEEAIKAGRMDEAQNLLDADSNRNARWHYLQSIVFFKKGWMSDSLKQLEFACNMDPSNADYREAKEKLIQRMRANSGNNDTSFYGERKESQGRTYTTGTDPNTMARGCTPCDCCSSLICADCCCECCGGDLIACC